jgi:hypothetical protein
MSISFRNDFGPGIGDATVGGLAVVAHTVGGVNGSTPAAGLTDSVRYTAKFGDSTAVITPVPSATFSDPNGTRPGEFGTYEPRNTESRSQDLHTIDARLLDLKTGAPPRDLPDVKMDQIRELLFGEVQRQSEQRITTLEAKVRDLELSLQHRLDAMQARIDALAVETRGEHRSTLDELARGIADLGDRVKRIPRE